MKYTLSLLLVGAFFVGTAYAPGKRPAAKTPSLTDAQKIAAVAAADWSKRRGDNEMPPSDRGKLFVYNGGCMPDNLKMSWSNHLQRCVHEVG
jgi:hypothetical protein